MAVTNVVQGTSVLNHFIDGKQVEGESGRLGDVFLQLTEGLGQ